MVVGEARASVAGGGSKFGKGSLIVCQVGELGEC